MRKVIVALLLAVFASVALIGCSGSKSDDDIIMVPSEDEEMNEAIRNAQESLQHFWSVFENPENEEDGFALKVKIEDGKGNVEHFWTGNIRKEDEKKIFATIDNEPVNVKTVEYGQEIEVIENDISDWMYIKDGKIYGAFTVRVLLDEMSEEEADELRSQLSDEPY